MDDGTILSARGTAGYVKPAVSYHPRGEGVFREMRPAWIDFRIDVRLLRYLKMSLGRLEFGDSRLYGGISDRYRIEARM